MDEICVTSFFILIKGLFKIFSKHGLTLSMHVVHWELTAKGLGL
jgi:hypothetical protein